MINSHYVPKFILKNFAKKVCLFNVRTGEYKENVKIDKAFSESGLYTDEVEEKLNKRIESQFANLFEKKLSVAKDVIELDRTELYLIKKFLLISVIRSLGNEEFLRQEKRYYDNLNEFGKQFSKECGLKEKHIDPPFIEKEIEGETSFEYWMRTLNVILDTNGTPEEILKHPNKTYPAHRWATVINNGYLAFWDSEFDHDEFLITDIGVTSENEKGWNGTTRHNVKKTNFLISLLEKPTNALEKSEIVRFLNLHSCFTENFMMFPISAKRMIVEIDPFFKFRIAFKERYDMPTLDSLTEIPNENLFYPNKAKYINIQKPFSSFNYHPNDKYIYEIKKLTRNETRYCNELYLDRIDTWVGFSSISKAVGSIVGYKRANSYPFLPRVDYRELYDLINIKYLSSIDVDTIAKLR